MAAPIGTQVPAKTLMYTGMYAYQKTTLATEDRMALDQSVFFGNRISFSAPPFDCERIGKIAVQAPGTAVANCDLSTPGPHAPRHICYLGHDGDRAIHGFFDKTGTDRWHEISPAISVDWTVVSESQDLVLLLDRSRNLYFEIDLRLNRMRWKVGASGAWVASHTVTGHD